MHEHLSKDPSVPAYLLFPSDADCERAFTLLTAAAEQKHAKRAAASNGLRDPDDELVELEEPTSLSVRFCR